MPRTIAEIRADMTALATDDSFTSSLIPANVKKHLALAAEMVEAAEALESRVDELAETFADFVAAHEAPPQV